MSDPPPRSSKVFFMIGCQRSGSNWLRTMLGEREDLIAPHPPHIIRDFMPILSKFGELDDMENLKVLVDHVCTFVESNQVTWYDKHDRPIKFLRKDITTGAHVTVQCLRAVESLKLQLQGSNEDEDGHGQQEDVDRGEGTSPSPSAADPAAAIIDNKYYLLAIFDEIMNYCAQVNDKQTWMCKSMGMSKYHDMLLTMYGPERLRYIYLVRDPRDVTLSFMKTPVGDCHPYSVSKKWAALQDQALYIKDKDPSLLLKVHYEDVLQDKVNQISRINEFIGERSTAAKKTMRRGSVVVIKDSDRMASESKKGHEATKAAVLSYQFKNLTRGASFTREQFQKWMREMEESDARIVEIVAKDQMALLGYECWYIDETSNESFSKEEIERFEEENIKLIEDMYATLKTENPGDYERRIKQSSVLEREAQYITESFVDQVCDLDAIDMRRRSCLASSLCYDMEEFVNVENHDFGSWPKDADRFGYLPEEKVDIHVAEMKSIKLSNGRLLCFSSATQRGYYPGEKDKNNQDCYISGLPVSSWQDGPDGNSGLLFSVFDGHGFNGDECSAFVRDKIQEHFEGIGKQWSENNQKRSTESEFRSAFYNANEKLMDNVEIDSSNSGTTAITLFIENDTFHVANVGDSRCILGLSSGNDEEEVPLEERDIVLQVLSQDQTPERKDEMERIQACGGLVMSSKAFDEMKRIESCGDCSTKKSHAINETSDPINEGEPLRIWSPTADKLPGCAFSRSIGDDIAKSIGVTAEPEYCKCTIRDEHEVFIMGSDGIFDFIANDEAVRISKKYDDPSEACRALVGLAYARWINNEDRTDDITVIIGFLK